MDAGWWFAYCPRCGGHGRLFLRRPQAEAGLRLVCEECSLTFEQPALVVRHEAGKEGFRATYVTPTEEQIDAAGWRRFCAYKWDDCPPWPPGLAP